MATLVDTSVWVAVLRGTQDPGLAATVGTLMRSGEARWCPIVRLELWAGVRGDRERQQLATLDRAVPEIGIDDRVWHMAVSLADHARAGGLTTPPADLLIFACARVHRADLLHRDRHFDLLAAL